MVPRATNFSYAAQAGLFYKLHAHHQVVVKEFAGVFTVGADTADFWRLGGLQH